MDLNRNCLMNDAVPVSVIDEMIEELTAEQDDLNHVIMHSIIALELLKARWERVKQHENSDI